MPEDDRHTMVIVAPLGIAVQQAGLDGTMKWSEVTGIKIQSRRVVILIAGGTIVIPNYYDASPKYIGAQMKRYHQG